MKSMPNGVAELDPNLVWVIERYLELIEEFARDPKAFGTGGLAGVEAVDSIRLAVVRRDEKAEERAILDGMRAEVREFWQEFSELQLLGENFRRAALRKDMRGSRGRTDPDSFEEGLQLARALLTHVPGQGTAAPHPGRVPVEPGVGIRSRVVSSGRPVAVSHRSTHPPRAAKVHQTLQVQPGLL